MSETVAGRYRCLERLGEGGAASTWRAEDLVRGHDVALKIVRPGLEQTLERELDLLGRVRHPHLPLLYDFGRDGERAYYAAQLVRGGPIARFDPIVLTDVLDALAFLHRIGVRHGDVKPDNVLVDERGRGMLIDLGCAAPLETIAGDSISGTPGFLAPELLCPGERVDGRADVFAFGRTLEALGDLPEPWTRIARRALSQARPDVREVLEAIGAGDRAIAPLPLESGRLFGRDAILERFDAARSWILHGEPGSGRTRLLTELARRAQRLGRTVIEASVRQASPIDSWFLRSGVEVRPGIEGALEALARLRGSYVWVLDDADRLEPNEHRRFTAIARAGGVTVLAVRDPIDGVETIEVGPLDRAAIAAWAEGRVDARAVDGLARLSNGHAGTVRALLGQEDLSADRASALARLGSPARDAIEWLAAIDDPIDPIELRALASDDGIDEALARGWAAIDGGLVRLARPADAAVIPSSRAKHEVLFERARDPADRLRHAALAGRVGDALSIPHAEGARWRRAAEALIACPDRRLRSEGARLLERAGASARVVEVLAAISDRTPDERRRLAAALLRLERTSEAIDELAGDADPAAIDVVCRARIKRGEHEQAIALAERALGSASEPSIVAALHEDLGVALSYRGDARAERHLREAEKLATGARERVRIASYLAIDAYRRGEIDRAREGYERALAVAEANGLEDQIAHAALNLGTVHHQRGAWGAAHAAYTRGRRIAHALGQAATLATLDLDDAQLYADIGALARARDAEERARRGAERGGFALLEGACALVRAQIAIEERRGAEARAAIAAARDRFAGLTRELAEVALIEARLASSEGDRAAALRFLDAIGDVADDVAVRRDVEIARADPARARPVLERALAVAERRGFAALAAEVHAELARVWRASGAPAIAEGHRNRAVEAWERIAAELDPALRDALWAHPSRADLRMEASPARSSERERRLTLLLSINRKLSSTVAVDDVLHQAMDAAIELTGAERGFLVLSSDDGVLDVPVARNLDKERIGRSHLKFSRSIAERAIETGEPVVTIDALEDARFAGNASVHAMKLRSVIAVPIPSPEGVVGAMYLDNRFERGRFAEVDTDLLRAFADQVAIALANARRTEALAARTRDLEEERARVEALSRGQAEQIEKLSAQLADRQHALERRYDYGNLVARSAAMEPVLATLEKVIETPLTILVQGESGTGKELVARAVHFNGARRKGPFVTLNCAALPDALLESELFGHVRGAFTGADRDREGLMVAASGGTLFLDELGEMSLAMQAKLLRALEQREVRPVGGTRSVSVDFRLVCATNRVLADEARAGRFREDLYYRIGVVELRLPPLRERLEDIPELARRIVESAAKELGREPPSIGADAMKALLSQRWPGNVRQLQNVLRAALVMGDGDVLRARHLAANAMIPAPRPAHSRAERDDREKARILEALEATDWNASAAAKRAGISRATLYRKLAKHGIEAGRR